MIRVQNPGYLNFVRQLPCLINGQEGVEAAHVRYKSRRYAKRETGMAEKPDDRWVVPLSSQRHREQHDMEEQEFWKQWDIDPLQVSSELHSIFPLKTPLEDRLDRAKDVCRNATNGRFPFFDER